MRTLRLASLALVPVAIVVACSASPGEDTRSGASGIIVRPLPVPVFPTVLPVNDPAHSVLTQHNDPGRDGAYTAEGTLKPANVKGANPACFKQAPLAPAPGSSTTTTSLGATVASNCYSPAFGEIATRPMVGDMAAQPLYAHGVNTSLGVRNLAIAATRENYVYAFDADSVDTNPASYTVWSGQIVPGVAALQQPSGANLGPCGSTPSGIAPACPNAIPAMVVPRANNSVCGQTKQHVGITSTPVVDPTTGYMYVVYRTGTAPGVEPVESSYWLRAINIYNGAAVALGGPSSPDILIQGSDTVAGRSPLKFNAVLELNRPGLLLQKDPTSGHNILYLAFGSAACDYGGDPVPEPVEGGNPPGATGTNGTTGTGLTAAQIAQNDAYYPVGWVFAYDTADNMASAAFSTMRDDPQKYGDTIWQSGNGLLGDGQSVYFFTGNATTESTLSTFTGGLNEALVKLQVTTSPMALNFVSHWQDPDAQEEDSDDADMAAGVKGITADADLGAGGPMIIPGTSLIAGGGKPGTIFTFNGTSNLQREPMAAQNRYCWPFPNPPFCSNVPGEGGSCPCQAYDAENRPTYEESQAWGPNIHVGLVGWQSSNGNSYIYSMAEKDYLRSFPANISGVNFAAPTLSPVMSNWGMPGGHLGVSANGGTDGIVWALHYESNDKLPDLVHVKNGGAAGTPQNGAITNATGNAYHGVLYALDAVNLGLLYKDDAFHSEIPASPGGAVCTPGTAGCCTPGTAGCGQFFAKFTAPTVADGKMFRPTYTGTLNEALSATQAIRSGTYTGELLVYGQTSVPPTVVTNASGEMVAFEVDEHRTLNYAVQSAQNQSFGAWAGLSGNVKSTPSALSVGRSAVEVYFVSGNNAMFCSVGNATAGVANPFPAPQSPDGMVGQFNYSPALVANPLGSNELVFAVTTAGNLVTTTDTGACSMSGWQTLPGGPYASTPAVAQNANGYLDVFVLDRNGAMWTVSQSASGWTTTQFAGTDFASGPVVGREQNGTIDVFAVDAGGGLREIWQTTANGAFTSWSAATALLGAPFSTAPAIATNADESIELLVIDGNGNFQRQRETGPNTHAWAPSWETLAVGCTSAPAIGHNADGRLEAFGVCPDTVSGVNVWGVKHTWQMTTVNEANEFQPGLTSLAISSWPMWQWD